MEALLGEPQGRCCVLPLRASLWKVLGEPDSPPCVSARSTAPVCLPAGAHPTQQPAFLVPSLPSQALVSFSREAIFKKCLKDRLSRTAIYSHMSWPGPRLALHTLLCIVTVIKGKIQGTTAKEQNLCSPPAWFQFSPILTNHTVWDSYPTCLRFSLLIWKMGRMIQWARRSQ